MPILRSPLSILNAAEAYQRARQRTRFLFSIVEEAAYLDRPIVFRNPIVFYEGHLPVFTVNTLLKKALGQPGIDEKLENLFERGIDPKVPVDDDARGWPPREEILAYAAAADEQIVDALHHYAVHPVTGPLLQRGEAIFTCLEHELMHQETLLYIFHQLPYNMKKTPVNYEFKVSDLRPDSQMNRVPAGNATLGARRNEVVFGWDNEFDSYRVDVPEFSMSSHSVTNGEYLEFVESGGYQKKDFWSSEAWAWLEERGHEHPLFWQREKDSWLWRGMFATVPLPAAWPVWVSLAEANAYAHWRGKRLPSEAEFHRAAFGAPDGSERLHPWGDDPPVPEHGNFDFRMWDPVPVGSHPAGQSAWGIHDLVGNGWEWTSSEFESFPGFRPMASYPQYSADFFDGEHFVMKGASPGTATELIRPSFRNWFRGTYPYMYAKFRLVEN